MEKTEWKSSERKLLEAVFSEKEKTCEFLMDLEHILDSWTRIIVF